MNDRQIAALLSGERGTIEYSPQLYLSDIYGNQLSTLPGVKSVSVNLSNYRDNTWELNLEADVTDALDPVRDWVMVFLDVRAGRDPWQRFPLGLYRFDFPDGPDEPEGSTWELSGMSPELLLMRDMATTGYRVAPGGGILAAVKNILTSHGVPESRITFPPSAEEKTLPNGAYYDPVKDADGAFYLRIANNLLFQGGFGALQTDEWGQFFVSKTVSLEEKEATVFYGPKSAGGDDMLIATGIPKTRNTDRFANEVFVYSQDVNQEPPITATAQNTNPDSPVSIQNLGYTVSKTVAVDSLPDGVTADLLARAELARASSSHTERKIKTLQDPRRTADEVYRTEAQNAYGRTVIEGNWQVTSWGLELSEEPGEMEHTITRNELL